MSFNFIVYFNLNLFT